MIETEISLGPEEAEWGTVAMLGCDRISSLSKEQAS